LADPPIAVGAEGVSAGWVKELDASDETEAAFLDQIAEFEASVLIALGEVDN